MTPRIETLAQKKLVGKCLKMSLINDRTPELWKSFMPFRKTIANTIGTDLYSLQVYGNVDFTPRSEFTKWALTEVSDFEKVPQDFKPFTLVGGLYAVFIHKGSSKDDSIFQYIFNEWLPGNAEYSLDNRPHFEVLGEKYKNNSSSSEEEVWIPIKEK